MARLVGEETRITVLSLYFLPLLTLNVTQVLSAESSIRVEAYHQRSLSRE